MQLFIRFHYNIFQAYITLTEQCGGTRAQLARIEKQERPELQYSFVIPLSFQHRSILRTSDPLQTLLLPHLILSLPASAKRRPRRRATLPGKGMSDLKLFTASSIDWSHGQCCRVVITATAMLRSILFTGFLGLTFHCCPRRGVTRPQGSTLDADSS